jgi:hypothetical protein
MKVVESADVGRGGVRRVVAQPRPETEDRPRNPIPGITELSLGL